VAGAGVANASQTLATGYPGNPNGVGWFYSAYAEWPGSGTSNLFQNFATGDVLGVLLKSSSVQFYKNGTLVGTAAALPAGALYPIIQLNANSSASLTLAPRLWRICRRMRQAGTGRNLILALAGTPPTSIPASSYRTITLPPHIQQPIHPATLTSAAPLPLSRTAILKLSSRPLLTDRRTLPAWVWRAPHNHYLPILAIQTARLGLRTDMRSGQDLDSLTTSALLRPATFSAFS
jgi:hypothetical protein